MLGLSFLKRTKKYDTLASVASARGAMAEVLSLATQGIEDASSLGEMLSWERNYSLDKYREDFWTAVQFDLWVQHSKEIVLSVIVSVDRRDPTGQAKFWTPVLAQSFLTGRSGILFQYGYEQVENEQTWKWVHDADVGDLKAFASLFTLMK